MIKPVDFFHFYNFLFTLLLVTSCRHTYSQHLSICIQVWSTNIIKDERCHISFWQKGMVHILVTRYKVMKSFLLDD